MTFRYPCTGPVPTAGFAAFLERELGEPRRNLRAFARELRTAFGAPRVTLVGSGSSANLAAALALAERAGPGRRHAVASAFTFPTTLSALLAAGFEVTLADVEPDGFNLDPQTLRAAMRDDTAVVCVTHFLGFPCALEEILDVARARDAALFQDACESMDLVVTGAGGARRRALELGTVSTWSFYHPHHLSSFGGGAVVTLDESMQRRVESISHWGRACTCHVEDLACEAPPGPAHQFTYVRPGHNLEMSELNAAFGRFDLARWEENERRRRGHYAMLFGRLSGTPLRVWEPPEGSGSPFVFPFSPPGGNAAPFAARLASRGVEARTLMGGAAADFAGYRGRLHDAGSDRARRRARETLFVGVHQTLPDEDVAAVAAILADEASRC